MDDDFEYRCAPACRRASSGEQWLRPAMGRLLRARGAHAVLTMCPTSHSHVILPKHVAKNAPKGRLLSESEWRGLGVQQSRGWVHYAIHRPEPHILLFRRPLGTDPTTGLVHGKRIDPATGKVVA